MLAQPSQKIDKGLFFFPSAHPFAFSHTKTLHTHPFAADKKIPMDLNSLLRHVLYMELFDRTKERFTDHSVVPQPSFDNVEA